MTTRDEMVALVERVEAATGADRQLEYAIGWGVGGFDVAPERHGFIMPNSPADKRCPAYTASLDAAMSLVPEGARFVIDSDGCHCRITKPDDESWPYPGFTGFAGTMALALTAACLRARAALAGDA